jgi:hypothetical protein
MAKCNIMDPPLISEDFICLGMQQWQKKTLQTSLCRLLLASTIYNLWGNRNEIRYGGKPNIEEQQMKKIQWIVRTRLLTKGHFRRTTGNVDICCNLGIENGVLV